MQQGSRRWILVVAALAGLTGALLAADWWVGVPEGRRATYVGRQSCADCHAQELRDWTGSDHDLAMDLATPASVLGDFSDQEFTYQGVTSRMFRRGDTFMIHTEGPDGQMRDYPIKYTFGVRPLQQYMVEFPDGRVQVLRVSWDTERKRWFNVPPPDVLDQRIEPGDPLHWTGMAQNWNHMCADCHSTDVQKNYDLKTNTYHTQFSEIDVSCEACHGPGSVHVELAGAASLFWDRRLGYGLAKLKGKDSKAQLDSCAPCHSRRHIVHPEFQSGREFLDYYEPSLLEAGLYHADGQILDEVYEYGSFLQSRMHREGVRCTDCHDPHTTRLKFQGNQLCAQCHVPGKYDTPAHHHHQVNSPGAQCVECHMPATKYMVVDPRRDHSLRVPRPDHSVQFGTPNACNGCHKKKEETYAWAAAKVIEWYGSRRPDDPHYAPAITAVRTGKPEGQSLLLKLLARTQTPAIVRATATELLTLYPGVESARAIEPSLSHASPLVRAAAARSLFPRTPGEMLRSLAPLLTDPVRSVRTAAAVRLAGAPQSLLTEQQRSALREAIEEYEAGQMASSDRAAAHLNLGNLYQSSGRWDDAIAAYRTAIRVEPYLAGARSNLASLLEQRTGDAAEVQRLRTEEVERLARDARLLPDNALVRYRHGLMLYLLRREDEALTELEAACQLEPNGYDYRLMLTLLYERRAAWDDALRSVSQLAELRANDPTAAELQTRIQAAAGREARGDKASGG
jgi:predicted CXXCH cytochrome family protein